jgi:hypothetical protein
VLEAARDQLRFEHDRQEAGTAIDQLVARHVVLLRRVNFDD